MTDFDNRDGNDDDDSQPIWVRETNWDDNLRCLQKETEILCPDIDIIIIIIFYPIKPHSFFH